MKSDSVPVANDMNEDTIEKLKKLTGAFNEQLAAYKSGHYNETTLRLQFVDPFFELLGWDVYNRQGLAESYKDVVHEDSIKVGDLTKAPDYSFRVGPARKFFLETKKPSVNIKDDENPAFQLRRYGWSAELPLSILTDFEEFAVYDTTVEPKPGDKASVARLFYCRFDEYEKHFEFIYNTFSKEAVLKGRFDEYAKSDTKKKGTSDLDQKFLTSIEKWREKLAKNIALRNELDVYGLNFAVQVTIDRILFLRITEDRGIDEYGRLLKLTENKDIYKNLQTIFDDADDKYNSGLFHFKTETTRSTEPDRLTPSLAIDDKVLKEIIRELYYPLSPYEFSVITADLLGSVYEQFLGKVIRITGKSAKVETKEEVQKAGGVYYTPKYIVEYIVDTTLGEFLKKKTPKQVAGKVKGHKPVRVLDMACGSGSFLISAYQYLLNWYKDWYIKHDPEKHRNEVYRGEKGEYYLTINKKKEILTTHIYGVDIDSQAVEVTKLNLLLKVLEGESKQTVEADKKLFNERALPDLGSNIKAGNSLVGADIYSQGSFDFTDEEKHRINIFDWQVAFNDIFSGDDPGFDVIIGNPPYVRQEILGNIFKDYAKTHYKTYAGTADLYVYFIEKSFELLNKKGLYSIIVANKWLRANYGAALRNFLSSKRIFELIDFGDLPVFEKATTYPVIIRAKNGQPQAFKAVKQHEDLLQNKSQILLKKTVKKQSYAVPLESLSDGNWSLNSEAEFALIQKLKKNSVPLGEYVDGKIYRGVVSGYDVAFRIDEKVKKDILKKSPNDDELIRPYLEGKDVQKYKKPVIKKYIIFTRHGLDINKYPAIKEHLLQYKKRLTPKPNDYKGDWEGRAAGNYKWFELQTPVNYYKEFSKPKIIYLKFQVKPQFTMDFDGSVINSANWMIVAEDYSLLGILNSKLGWFLISNFCTKIKNGYQLIYDYLKQVPIAKNIKKNRSDFY